jgi:NADH:ubiquinone oxidoreductase subunit 6 (subunit J)
VELHFPTIMFWALAAGGVASAVMVLLARDIVRVAFWLLGALMAVAGLYLLLDADFLGITQVLVYVGGILVLILFGIMMTHRESSVIAVAEGSRRSLVTGLLVAGVTFAVLASLIGGVGWRPARPGTAVPTTRDLGVALLTDYVLPFELISVLLLVVLCGAVYVARRGEGGRRA